MKKYLIFSISLVFILSIMACKPKQDPITLAARAGTYTGQNEAATIKITIKINDNGTGTFQNNSDPIADITLGNPASTDTKFVFTEQAGSVQHIFTIIFENTTTALLNTPTGDGYYEGKVFMLNRN